MNRTTTIALFACCLVGIAPLHAQESPVIPLTRMMSVQQQLSTPLSVKFSNTWFLEQTDPILRQRRQIRAMMEQRAQQSAIPRREGISQQQVNKNAGLWKVTAGNTSADNWSPFPDRALDARMIRYPLPRGMQPDHRPEAMKQTGKIKK